MSHPAPFDQGRPRLTAAVQALIAACAAVAFLQATVVHADDMRAALGFSRAAVMESNRWWTIVTYMFVHGGAWHLLVTLLPLWLFGPRLEAAWGTRKFLWFYLASGLGGLALHLVLHALFATDGVLFGATAAVFGVMGAFAMQWPEDHLFLFGVVRVRVRTLIVVFVACNMAMGLYGVGLDPEAGLNVAYLAHLGGFGVALAYMRTPPAVSIEQLRQRISPLPDTDDPPRAIPRTLPRSRERLEDVDEIVAKSKAVAAKRPAIATPAPRAREENESERVNRLLDKISEHGLASLTGEERLVLEELSRRLRGG